MSPSRTDRVETERPKASRRSHRKSRNGCLHCKRRKVKCDESRPTCSNCVRFAIECEYFKGKDRLPSKAIQEPGPTNNISPAESPNTAPILRRGRGRPRRDWTVPAASPSGSTTTPSSATAVLSSLSDISSSESGLALDIVNSELLLQFISSTAQSLIGSNGPNDPMWKFWAYEVPRMGLVNQNHFVLHLVFAIASHQLARLQVGVEDTGNRRSHYFTLAQSHFQEGLAGFRQTLPKLDSSNRMALFISAMLVCWCTFAAGPTGPGDLLVCDIDNEEVAYWIPLVHGVRIIQTAMGPIELPSNPAASCGIDKENAPTYSSQFPTIDWEEPLYSLRDYIASSDSPHVETCLQALRDMQAIFEEICGKSDGTRSESSDNRFVFGWLYRMREPFVTCLRAVEPLALVLLAHYAVLLGTMSECWFLEGWPQHLISAIDDLLGSEHKPWLRWPREQVLRLVMNTNTICT
ncbi:hypothetical protein F5Y04DRAFT_42180 [Hypomontagnella monticulosa]|nr:hypothetical protein F5Y04DRAFT_42180 [Hypomontagnella monticulosa]